MAPGSKKARASETSRGAGPVQPRTTCRELAVGILRDVERRGAYAGILLDQAIKKNPLPAEDRALLTQIVYGALRWRGKIDWALGRAVEKPLAGMDDYLRNLLRVTLYQILFLERVPAYAAVNEGVEIAKRYGGKGAAGLVNAVTRRLLREKDKLANPDGALDLVKRLSIVWSHPEWLVKKWLDYLGADDLEALLAANNEEAPLVVRANRLKTTRAELLEKFKAAGVDAAPAARAPEAVRLRGAASVERLPGFGDGLFFVQGEASQLIAFLLGPRPGERILDAAAAPGGKTTHLAELMDDAGEIVALDISARGIERLKQNSGRLGLASVRPILADAGLELTGAAALPYDRILADLPCTGLGTLGSHPEAKWRREEADVGRLARLQEKILGRVAGYLKPGGVLVYSTCTLTPEENERVVENFLHRHEEFTLESAADFLPEGARRMTRGNYFFALPHRDSTDGFFAARMRKRA